MIRKATKNDLEIVTNILVDSFFENKSVKYVVKQDYKETERFRFLMEYSFKKAFIHGNVFINKTNDACLLMIHKNIKNILSIKSFWLDILLVYKTIGLSNLYKVMDRKKLIEKEQPKTPFLYIWYVGVFKKEQAKGKGTELIEDIFEFYNDKFPFYLETSTKENFKWYKNLGFKRRKILKLGYELHIFSKHKCKNPF